MHEFCYDFFKNIYVNSFEKNEREEKYTLKNNS